MSVEILTLTNAPLIFVLLAPIWQHHLALFRLRSAFLGQDHIVVDTTLNQKLPTLGCQLVPTYCVSKNNGFNWNTAMIKKSEDLRWLFGCLSALGDPLKVPKSWSTSAFPLAGSSDISKGLDSISPFLTSDVMRWMGAVCWSLLGVNVWLETEGCYFNSKRSTILDTAIAMRCNDVLCRLLMKLAPEMGECGEPWIQGVCAFNRACDHQNKSRWRLWLPASCHLKFKNQTAQRGTPDKNMFIWDVLWVLGCTFFGSKISNPL